MGGRAHSTRRPITWRGPEKDGIGGGDLGRGASLVTTILGLDWRKEGEKREGAVNTVACRASLASPRLLEGLFGRKWSSDSGAQLNNVTSYATFRIVSARLNSE